MSARKRKHPTDDEDQSRNEDEDMEWEDEEGMHVDGIYIPPPIKPVTAHTFATRLLITKITNRFFKSYANEVVLGPFGKCFNAIVGPNGSGKSNVIDSMLFVFGYRAAKIRSKKLSVLLHNSEKYKNVQSCTVCVHFCEIIDRAGDDYDIVPGSEFTVSRTANKDNSSFYELNNRKVQFKEVAQLLRKHGIDLDHNRFLILQGEVEEIAMMKCKGATENETGMLEYLEDVIGTSRYKVPLNQLCERIETLSALRSEKLNRVKLIQKELDELKEPMEEAIVFLKTENKAMSCKNFIYQHKIFNLGNKSKELEAEKATVAESLNELNQRLDDVKKQKAEKESILEEESKKYHKLQTRKNKLKEAYENAIKKDDQLQADMTQLIKKRKKCKSQLEEEKNKLEQFRRAPEENQQKIVEYEAKESELKTKKETLETERTALLASVREETLDLQTAKEKYETQLQQLRKNVDETKRAFVLAENELNLAVSKENTERTKLEQIRESIAQAEETVEVKTKEVAALRKKIPLTEKSLRDAQDEVNGVKREQAQLITDLRKKKLSLEDSKSSMQMMKSRSRVLDALMEQKRKGNCDGLFGRLGDLGAIDEKYDIAISTACGPLDNIVVDHVDTAEWCIQFLKSRDIGRATFIALNKQEYLRPQAEGKIKTPENVHRLYDLIRVQDDRVKTAFYYALRDTLVADDLDQAGRIAYGSQRYRVVTLKGEIIEISGTMSGGGRTMLKGRMGRTRGSGSMIVSPKEIENMQRDIDESNHRLRTLTDQQTQLDRQIAALEPELQTMKCNLAKFVKDLQEAKEALPMLTKQLKQQEAIAQSTKSDGKQVEKLTKVVDDTKSKYQDASAVAQKIQEKCDAAKNEIEARTNSKMKQVNKNLSDVTKTIEKIKADLVKFRVEIANSKRNCERSEAKIASLEESITDAERTLKEMAAEKEVIETDAKKLLEHVEKLTDELLQGEEEFGDLKREVAAFVAQEKAIAFEKLDVDQAFKTVNEKLQEHTGGINHWRGKLSQLKLHDIPNEQQREELQTFTEEELESRNTEAAELELNAAETYIRAAKPNLNILQEYRKGHAVFVERSNELEQVTEKRNDMKALHDKVKEQRKDEFMVGYTTIKTKLKEMYQMITLGGDADFEIVDTFDPFSEGIQFNVRPPKKSWKVISNLSGGEKTLSSLALVFALHYYKPSPLYVMDEIDAALDFKNVSIVGQYIKDRTKNAQFIIISLRSNMFELCDNLVGIYKIFNCTQSITINPKGFHKKNAKKDEQVVPSGRTQNAPNRDASFDELRHNVAGPSTRKSQEIVPVATHESRLESQSTESMEENEEFDEDHVVEDSLAGSSQSSQASEQL